MKRGFTLVELSIVLVIIGLLIGGILVAQSMIQTAQIQRFVRDLQQYDIIGMQFKDKFRGIAGDTRFFTPAGNGDGIISGFTPGGESVCAPTLCQERHSYWKHLSDAGMMPSKYDNDWNTGLKPGINAPQFALGKLSLVAGYYASTESTCSVLGQYYTTSSTGVGISGASGYSIDQKIDDGVANTGKIKVCIGATACAITDPRCYITAGMLSILYK